jgi:PAS domain-containing protein
MTHTRSAPLDVRSGVQDADLLRVILEHSGQGVSVYDGDRRLLLWNERWLELLELPTRFGKYGTPLPEILLWQAQRGDFGAGDPVVETRRLLARFDVEELQEWERRTPGGDWLHFRKTPISGGGIAFFITDVTAARERDVSLAEHQVTLPPCWRTWTRASSSSMAPCASWRRIRPC